MHAQSRVGSGGAGAFREYESVFSILEGGSGSSSGLDAYYPNSPPPTPPPVTTQIVNNLQRSKRSKPPPPPPPLTPSPRSAHEQLHLSPVRPRSIPLPLKGADTTSGASGTTLGNHPRQIPPTTLSHRGGKAPVLIVLGATDTGKTTSVLYYVTGQHYPKKTMATIEDSYRKVLPHRKLPVEIIDTAGAPGISEPLRSMYRSNGDAFAIMYSVYSIDSWLRMVREFEEYKSTGRPILIIGTRCSSQSEPRRRISREQLIEFGYRHGVQVREMDLADGNDISLSFDLIIEAMEIDWARRSHGTGPGTSHNPGNGSGNGNGNGDPSPANRLRTRSLGCCWCFK